MKKIVFKFYEIKLLSFIVFGFFLSFSLTMHAQQQTYTLETSTFRLVFNRFNVAGDGYATGLRECRYLSTNKTFQMHERATCIAHLDRNQWDFPISASVFQITPNIKELTVNFIQGRSIKMNVKSHPYFLEFELLSVIGNYLDIWLFGPIFMGLSPNDWPVWDSLGQNHYEYNQITYLGNQYYAVLIPGNPNTFIYRNWEIPTSVFITPISPPYIPEPQGYIRNQRFAFLICKEEDLKNRVRDVENYFNFPYGVDLKDNYENNIDYLFLVDNKLIPAKNIIQICKQTNLGAVLLYQEFWSDWTDSTEAFKLRYSIANNDTLSIKDIIDSLKAADLIVGLHCYVHLLPKDGYFAKRYPDSVSSCIIDNTFRSMKWTTSLPDSVVHHFVSKALFLQPDWLYFDGNEGPYENCQFSSWDVYVSARQTEAILRELRQRNYTNLKIFQDAGSVYTYHYKSRIGQTDYWDNVSWHRNPIAHMNWTASQAIHRGRGLYKYTDLGWFGRDIHIPGGIGRRDATWEEWQHLANTSLTYNIPVGIRTTYNDFITDTLNPLIVPLLRETIRQRRNLTFIESKENLLPIFTLQQNYPNPFNPSTTIRFSIAHRAQVTLKIFDLLGRELETLVNEELNPGEYSMVFDATSIASGVYFYQLRAGTFIQTKKMLIIK
mgnify:CR=1 FL=1